jgi:hypothetical protein
MAKLPIWIVRKSAGTPERGPKKPCTYGAASLWVAEQLETVDEFYKHVRLCSVTLAITKLPAKLRHVYKIRSCLAADMSGENA